MEKVNEERWSYAEFRPLEPFRVVTTLPRTAVTYAFHQLDLWPSIATIFDNFHKSSTQRKIRRAGRENLVYREGTTQALLDDFYRLFTLTRKRQGLAPQSKEWFANLMECFGDALKVRVAFKDGQAIAAMITIRHKDTLTYKYGCTTLVLIVWAACTCCFGMPFRRQSFPASDFWILGAVTRINRV